MINENFKKDLVVMIGFFFFFFLLKDATLGESAMMEKNFWVIW